jgi:HSP20 family protein
MTLIRWEPLRESEEFMNRLMPSLLRGWPRAAGEGSAPAVQWTPSADISETETEYLVRAEMPAVRKEDVKVTVHDGTISIEGERRYEKQDKSEKFHRVETFQGRFARRFTLPEDADAAAIRAESRDGVLTVRIPKVRAVKPQPTQIPVS